jgi:hypothetical protein
MERIMTRMAFCLAGIAALAAAPAVAHHSFAMFDQSKVLFLSGTIKQYELINPHVWLHLAVVNDKGETATWVFEGGSATQMIYLGWSKDDIKLGEKAEIGFRPLRDGSRGGQLMSIKYPNGEKKCSHRGCGDGTGRALAD